MGGSWPQHDTSAGAFKFAPNRSHSNQAKEFNFILSQSLKQQSILDTIERNPCQEVAKEIRSG